MSGEFEPLSIEEVFEVPEFRYISPQIRGAFHWMDTVDVVPHKGSSVEVPPTFSSRPVPDCIAQHWQKSLPLNR